MNNLQPRPWFQRLTDIYDPARFSNQGGVLLLEGHGDDLFFCNVRQPSVPLYQLLYERFRKAVDAFAWYQVSGGGQLHYEFNRFPAANAAVRQPSAGPAAHDLLGLDDLEQDRVNWQAEHEGRASRNCTPQEAIREIDTLLKTPGHRAVMVFQNVNWAITENDLLAQLSYWPELCQEHHHLVVFALKQAGLRWVSTCFGEQKPIKGVKRLAVEGPTPDEIKAFLIQYHLKTGYDLFDWSLLNDVAARLGDTVGANPSEGFRSLVLEHIPRVKEAGSKLDQLWLNSQPSVGQKAEVVSLDDLVLKPGERAFFENSLLPALRDPDWRRQEAARLKLDPSKIQSPNRILLYGPPGTGKTTIGKMIATESRRRFYSVKAADFQSTYRGGPVEKVAQHFAEWRRNTPCVVFWDEVESIAANRAYSQHEDNPITQILAELEPTAGRDEELVIICATNLPEKLDPAFRSRFRSFLIGYPDQEGRARLIEQYFSIHLLEPGLTITDLTKLLEHRSPREIKYCAEACINQLSVRREQVVTRQMVQNWLITNPIDLQTVQHWQTEEAKQQRQLQELGLI